jgi:thioesterase domain-containing protein
VGSEERDIERHILSTQRPAATLGIVVDEVTSNSLTLSAPLEPNTNVHGTAFAGSLYSVAVLCAYYLGRSYLQRRPDVLHREFTVVARSGTIQYKRPVSHRIVAVSVLPEDEQILDRFAKELSDKGKAFMDVSGTIRTGDGKVACEYTIEVCAYEPRK